MSSAHRGQSNQGSLPGGGGPNVAPTELCGQGHLRHGLSHALDFPSPLPNRPPPWRVSHWDVIFLGVTKQDWVWGGRRYGSVCACTHRTELLLRKMAGGSPRGREGEEVPSKPTARAKAHRPRPILRPLSLRPLPGSAPGVVYKGHEDGPRSRPQARTPRPAAVAWPHLGRHTGQRGQPTGPRSSCVQLFKNTITCPSQTPPVLVNPSR